MRYQKKRTPWCDDADNSERLADSNHPLLPVRAGNHLSVKSFGFLREPFKETRTKQMVEVYRYSLLVVLWGEFEGTDSMLTRSELHPVHRPMVYHFPR